MLTFLTGLKNDIFWSETGSGFGEPGRLSHKLPINSKKLPLIAFKSCLKVAFFLKLPKSCYFFYLFALEVGFIAVFTGRIRLEFSFSSYFSFFGDSERFVPSLLVSAIGLIGPSSAGSSQLESESMTVLSGNFEKRVM